VRNKLIVAIVFAIAIAGIAYRVIIRKMETDELSKIYPKLEQLVGIYSLVGWRHSQQQAPNIKEDNDFGRGGREFTLVCDKGNKWGTGGFFPGELFSCFMERRHVVIDGEEIEAFQVVTNEDYWYEFEWISLFGYDLHVTISPRSATHTELYKLRDQLNDTSACEQELARFDKADRVKLCSFSIWAVEISGLTHSRSVPFLVSNGYLSWLADGSVDRREEWVIYMKDVTPITLGAVNKFIQLTVRKMQITDTDLSKIVPELEAKWMNKDKAFLDSLFDELDHIPDLMKISDFLKGRP
jgi:hypothetical protein